MVLCVDILNKEGEEVYSGGGVGGLNTITGSIVSSQPWAVGCKLGWQILSAENF